MLNTTTTTFILLHRVDLLMMRLCHFLVLEMSYCKKADSTVGVYKILITTKEFEGVNFEDIKLFEGDSLFLTHE